MAALDPPNGISDEAYEILSGLLPLLKQLQASLHVADPNPFTVIAGQGRGSRKPPATLRSVEIIPESRKA